MIFALEGVVFKLESARVLLKIEGIIYEVFISLATSSKLKADTKAFLFITQIIREDAHLLFGFFDESEKQMFDRLIKINGVGPKVALGILSTYDTQMLLDIIKKQDVKALQRVSGIGAKSAGKIMVDLAGFYMESNEFDDTKREAKMALESLGFKISEIDKALKKITASQTQEIIKEALKILR